jgi:hypothetical protein
MTKLMTTQEIRKKISVNESWLAHDGLELLYWYGGKEKYYQFSPLETAKLFKTCGLIHDYESAHFTGSPFIKWMVTFYGMDHHNEHTEREIMMCDSWDVFRQNFELSQYDAITLAVHIQDMENMKDFETAVINTAKNKFLVHSNAIGVFNREPR